MAHFAELDDNNVVLRVIVVNNEDIVDENGNESEEIGKAFCQNLLGGRWVQTSYNHKFRNKYSAITDIYREDLDAFIPAQPYASWTFNEQELKWEAPVPRPNDNLMYQWDEKKGDWEALTFEVPD